MPNRNALPTYRHQKARGLAVVRLNGRDIYLGPYGSKASRAEYDRVVGEWLEAGRTIAPKRSAVSVAEVCLAFLKAKAFPTTHESAFKRIISILAQLYGPTPADEFGPLALKVVRKEMVAAGWKRQTINKRVHNLRQIFRWAVGNELIPETVINRLDEVAALREGETSAPESEDVEPVDSAYVEKTMAFALPILRDMVQIQLLTGMRPSEMLRMRTCDIDTKDAAVWVYKPATHKSKGKGKKRLVPIGPRAIEVLTPYLLPDLQANIFSPARTMATVRAARAANRKTPAGQGNRPGSNRVKNPKKQPGASYTAAAYRDAIYAACDRCFPPPEHLARLKGEKLPAWGKRLTAEQREELRQHRAAHRWHPYQLRHTFGQMVRDEFGLEHTQPALGHAHANTTEIYARASLAKAKEVAAKIG